jgi:phospholipase/carboxylesterase
MLRAPVEAAAMALLSASRIAWDEWEPLVAARPFSGLPVLVSHGQIDNDLAFGAGEALRDCLTAAGAAVEWVPFETGHEIPLVVWRRLRALLLRLAA